MKRMLLVLMVASLFLPTTAMWAQENAGDQIAEVHYMKPKAGMTSHFEAGRKRHMAWHKAQNDQWSWMTWEILTGDRTGAYLVISPGHQWKDFDSREKFDVEDSKDAEASTAGLVDESGMSYWVVRGDLSRNPSLTTPSKYITSARYWIDPTMTATFTDAIKKINAGMDKVKYPAKPSRWVQLANGGDAPQFVLQTDRTSYADMEPLSKSVDDAMAEAYGKEEGAALMAGLRKSIKRLTTEMRVWRPDLSYIPGK